MRKIHKTNQTKKANKEKAYEVINKNHNLDSNHTIFSNMNPTF